LDLAGRLRSVLLRKERGNSGRLAGRLNKTFAILAGVPGDSPRGLFEQLKQGGGWPWEKYLESPVKERDGGSSGEPDRSAGASVSCGGICMASHARAGAGFLLRGLG
jgi:hypothetical protein